MKMYIAVLDEFPDYMTPTLVAHSVLGAHLVFSRKLNYEDWLANSYKKCVVRVNQKEFTKLRQLPNIYVGYEKNTLDGRDSCIIPCPMPDDELPNVLKFAKLWRPKE